MQAFREWYVVFSIRLILIYLMYVYSFAAACTGGGRPSVTRVTAAARRLADKRHYAEPEITALAHRLERAYKQLSNGNIYLRSFI